jgi:hypothetical protein
MSIKKLGGELAFASPLLRPLWDDWDQLKLPDCWLVAGCLAQTVWNDRFRLPPEHGISDIDIVYFDPEDTSAKAEEQHSERVRKLFSHLPVWVDVKNEARVHLWYESKFGYPIAPYHSTKGAIDTFPTTATSVGIRPVRNEVEVYSTFGLEDLFSGTVRANKRQVNREIFEAKVAKWLARWPKLSVVGWDDDV